MSRRARERRLIGGLAVTLAALLAGVALVLVGDARRSAGTSVPDADVAVLVMERPGFDDVVMERDGDDWRVTAPCAVDADDARVEPLLAALAAGGAGYAAGEVDLQAAGLDEPLASVRLDGERILLGGTDLGGERRYARRGERITLVPEWSLSLVAGGLSAFAELAPFDSPPTRLVLTGAQATALVGTEADADAGDGDETAETIDPGPWSSLTAERLTPWPVPDAPPLTGRARLEATFADGGRRAIEITATPRWTALRLDEAACAYLFGTDALPGDLFR